MPGRKLRIIDSGLCEPSFTAAADDALFWARTEGRAPDTLHFYVRDRPTVSLGYFQSVKEDLDTEFCQEKGITVIRRATGGSAIYTDSGQVIYALALEDTFPEDREAAYRIICGGIIDALRELGITAEFKPPNDVRVGGKKISGSAQRRKSGFILQHGTLIFRLDRDMMFGSLRDKGAPDDITSLEEVLGYVLDAEEVKKALEAAFLTILDAEPETASFTEFEREKINRLISEKYGNEEWNFKR